MQERGQAASKLLVEAVHVLGTSITYCCWGLQATALNLASRLATCPKHRRNPVSAQRQRWKAAVPFVCPGKLRHIRTAVSVGSAPAPALPAALSPGPSRSAVLCGAAAGARGQTRPRMLRGFGLGAGMQSSAPPPFRPPIALLSPTFSPWRMLQCIPGSHPTGAAVPLGGTQKMRSVWAQRQKCCVLPFSPCAAPQGCSSLPWSSPTLARVGCSAPPTCCRKATHPRRLESELCSARGAGAAGAPWQGSALLHPRLRAALGRRGRLHLPPPAPQRRDGIVAVLQRKWATRFGFPFIMHIGCNRPTHSPNNGAMENPSSIARAGFPQPGLMPGLPA